MSEAGPFALELRVKLPLASGWSRQSSLPLKLVADSFSRLTGIVPTLLYGHS